MTPHKQFREVLEVFRNAKKRAARAGLDYSLTPEDVQALWERCGGRCEVTGIEFEFEAMDGKYVRRPFAPSADRIDNAKGYVLGNVQLVCVIVNYAMNTWGEHALMRVAIGMYNNGRRNHVQHRGLAPTALPQDVRAMVGAKGLRYAARARDFGKETHLGMFDTIDQALEARYAWAKANSSLKVLRQIHEFTRSAELLNEINTLRAA